jgi:hypothetical protein
MAMKRGAFWSARNQTGWRVRLPPLSKLYGELSMSKMTGPKAAKAASHVLNSPSTGKASKAAAGSALTQSRTRGESTSPKAATAASQVLRDGRTSAASKTAAGSALSQARGKK